MASMGVTETRFYRINSFIAPKLDWLVPGWRFAALADSYRASSGEYSGPLYLVFTNDDAVVLIRNAPDDQPDALDIISRFSLQCRIDPGTATGELREADNAQRAEALRCLAQSRDTGAGQVVPITPVWVAGQVGFCVHEEPHLVSVFQFRDGRCTDAVSSTEAQRILPLAEE